MAYSALVPNVRGLEDALAAGADEVAVFAAASATFSVKNGGASIADTLARIEAVCRSAAERGVRVRGYVSTVLGCPYEGAVPIARVVEVSERLFAMGCAEVSLGRHDRHGHAPGSRRSLSAPSARRSRPSAWRFTSTTPTARRWPTSARACRWESGAIDASAGGLGGCPYAPGASGNVATEDVVYLLDGMGIETGVDAAAVARASWRVCESIGREPAGRAARALGRETRSHNR